MRVQLHIIRDGVNQPRKLCNHSNMIKYHTI